MNVSHFPSPEKFREWLEANHATATEIQVSFYKKNSGHAGLTYIQAVDEALCFGWIDGIIQKIDAESFTHRFTPRKTGSIWSNRNVANVLRLTAQGKMHAAGRRTFETRQIGKTGIYSFEQKVQPNLTRSQLKEFRGNKKAWAFFTAQAPSYQRKIMHHIASAKMASTRLRRLERAIQASADRKLI